MACPYSGSLVIECDRMAGLEVTPATASSLMSLREAAVIQHFLADVVQPDALSELVQLHEGI